MWPVCFGGRKGHMFASKASKRRIGPQIKYPLKKNGSYFLSNFSLKVMTTMTPFKVGIMQLDHIRFVKSLFNF